MTSLPDVQLGINLIPYRHPLPVLERGNPLRAASISQNSGMPFSLGITLIAIDGNLQPLVGCMFHMQLCLLVSADQNS